MIFYWSILLCGHRWLAGVVVDNDVTASHIDWRVVINRAYVRIRLVSVYVVIVHTIKYTVTC